jgi:aspartyl-tRNA(Asn)/glutamyl-tRNA(Gln) amidotransferase subunit C
MTSQEHQSPSTEATITTETVAHVAKLARLELTEDELGKVQQDLSRILGLVDQLNQLNLDQLNPEDVHGTMTLDQTDQHPIVLREDAPKAPMGRDVLLKNAPHEEDGFFRVPQILESN